jgi:hypothetical protein
MGHEPGRKGDGGAGGGIAAALGRGTAFVLLAGAGLVLLAAVILLPAWAEAARAEYQRACLTADVADARARALAVRRYADALEAGNDEVLLQRHLARYLNITPPGETLPITRAAFWRENGTRRRLPDGAPVVLYEPAPRPAPPSRRWLAMADRLENPARRRGLLLLACAALAAGVLLFPPRAN